MNHNTLASALEKRSNAEGELDQAVTDVENLSRQDLAGVEPDHYEAVVQHFNMRMAAWELAQQEVEDVIPLDEMDDLIGHAFDYCMSALNTRVQLVSRWDAAKIPRDSHTEEKRGTEQSRTTGGLKNKGDKERQHREPRGSAGDLHTPGSICSFCGEVHATSKCRAFLKKTVYHRLEYCKAKRLCFRCLHKNHYSRSCSSTCDH